VFSLLRYFIWTGIFVGMELSMSWASTGNRLAGHSGYVTTIEEERNQDHIEVIMIPRPIRESWQQKIFAPELVREFKARYESEFGRTEAEQIINIPNELYIFDSTYELGSTRQTSAVEDLEKRRLFGEYVLKRLSEHHVDNYVKNDPAMRPVYEIKERISHANVQVSPGYSMSLNYRYSANNLQVKVVNPYLLSEVLFEMDPTKFGPTKVRETTYTLGYTFSPKLTIVTYYREVSKSLSIVGIRSIRPNLGTSLTASSNLEGIGKAEAWTLLAGLSWRY